MTAKFKKLWKHPGKFVRDMVDKRLVKAGLREPRETYRGTYRYSVIAAVYGVEAYLEDFFKSLVTQSVSFEKHIQLIMVDDGSPDGSAAIIKRWQARYPKNITCIRKENGGQASARNAGLPSATGDWVTFIDPDDFVDRRYFEEADRFLSSSRAGNVALLCCNTIFYEETTGQYADRHPLKWRFAKEQIVEARSPGNYFHMPVNCAFFRRSQLERTGVSFDVRVKPNFEDGHFVGKFLLASQDSCIGFAPKAKYYYRKREDGSSTLDGSWERPERYLDVFEYGYGDLFREALQRQGQLPLWVQRVVLYDLMWYVKRLVNHPELVAFLGADGIESFKSHFLGLLRRMDKSTIVDFELAGIWFYHKVGLLGLRRERPGFQIAYIDSYDAGRQLLGLRYFYAGEAQVEAYQLDGQDVIPAFAKTRRDDFLGETFVYERIVWLPLSQGGDLLTMTLGSVPVRLSFHGRQHKQGVSAGQVQLELRPEPVDDKALPADAVSLRRRACSSAVAARFRDAWLLMDRDTQADDNGEHFYRYLVKARPDINSFFVLRRNSHDWGRLKRDGFRLLAFDSDEHKLALLNARHVISSHADAYVYELLPTEQYRDLLSYQFTFLQHGVTKDDLSAWLNAKPIRCFITTTPQEHQSIAGDANRYKFSQRETVLTGFPRHDALVKQSVETEKLLVIMPTWRHSLTGKRLGKGSENAINPEFQQSEYARRWQSILQSPRLRQIAETCGFRVLFFPHAAIQPYLGWFQIPGWIEVSSHAKGESIQLLFGRASVLVTDYSSVAFEMALLEKPTVYYQFDEAEVFGGGHTTQRGYFDYRRDGFGPVCLEEDEVLAGLEAILVGGVSSEYRERMRRTFPFRDGKNCERTLEAILALDVPLKRSSQQDELLVEYARRASARGDWALAESRWARVACLPPNARSADTCLRQVEALRQVGRVSEAEALLSQVPAGPERELEVAELASAREQWGLARTLWEKLRRAVPAGEGMNWHIVARVAEACRQEGSLADARDVLDGVHEVPAPLEILVERAELLSAEQRWAEALVAWEPLGDSRHPSLGLRVALRRAEARFRLGQRSRARAEVAAVLSTIPEAATASGWLAVAELLLREQGPTALEAHAQAVTALAALLPRPTELLRLARILKSMALYDDAATLLARVESEPSLVVPAAVEKLDLLLAMEDWDSLVRFDLGVLSQGSVEQRLGGSLAVCAAYRQEGQLARAKILSERLLNDHPRSPRVAFEVAELCLASGDWSRAAMLLRGLSKEHPQWQPSLVRVRLIRALDAQGDASAVAALLSAHVRELMLQQLREGQSDLSLSTLMLAMGQQAGLLTNATEGVAPKQPESIRPSVGD